MKDFSSFTLGVETARTIGLRCLSGLGFSRVVDEGSETGAVAMLESADDKTVACQLHVDILISEKLSDQFRDFGLPRHKYYCSKCENLQVHG
jgi:hypothetical protein